MNDGPIHVKQLDILASRATKSLLDQLITNSRLCTRSKEYKDLLDFIVRLRKLAPFNANASASSKAGWSYAGSERDWLERIGRGPKTVDLFSH